MMVTIIYMSEHGDELGRVQKFFPAAWPAARLKKRIRELWEGRELEWLHSDTRSITALIPTQDGNKAVHITPEVTGGLSVV